MKQLPRILPALLLLPLVLPIGDPPEAPQVTGPMAPFQRLVGTWRGEDASYYHVYEWGIEGKSLHGRSFAVGARGDVLQSDGIWYWHPVEKRFKGHVVAVNMPFAILEITARFENDRFISDMRAVEAGGKVAEYVEIIHLVDDDHFDWSLAVPTENGPKPMLEARYLRVKEE